MPEKYIASYVPQDELMECLRTRKPKKKDTIPYLMVEPIERFDSDALRCNFFVKHEIGDHSLDDKAWRIMNEWDTRGNVILIDHFEKNQDCYVTFDGVSFHKIIDVQTKPNKDLEITLKRLINPSYLNRNTAFMIMPFGSMKLNSMYKENIAEFLSSKLQIKITRSDDYTDNDVIVDRIYAEIEKSEFIICEITDCNKNVFYEIGYAKGINKQIIFIAQRGIKDLKFFDTAHIRRIDYDVDNPTELQEKLKDTILTIRNKIN